MGREKKPIFEAKTGTMSSQIQRVTELITAYESYLESQPTDQSVEGFIRWYAEKLDLVEKQAEAETTDKPKDFIEKYRSVLLLKHQTRPQIQASSLSGLDDYILMQDMQAHPNLVKKDLIALSGIEYSTAIEILVRLKKRGLIKELIAPHDKRSRLVALSAKGARVLAEFEEAFNQSLTDSEGSGM